MGYSLTENLIVGNIPRRGPICPSVEVERSKRVSGRTGHGSRFLFLVADFTVDIRGLVMMNVEF